MALAYTDTRVSNMAERYIWVTIAYHKHHLRHQSRVGITSLRHSSSMIVYVKSDWNSRENASEAKQEPFPALMHLSPYSDIDS